MAARSAPTWPRALGRETAALYCDLTVSAFEREVAAGRLPPPAMLGGKEHWSRPQIDECLDRLFGDALPDVEAMMPMYRPDFRG